MPKNKSRNTYIERAVNRALGRIDDFMGGAELLTLPSASHRRACDQVLQNRSASARVAGLFLASYRDANWAVPAQMALTLRQYERDIAIIDIDDVINFLGAELTAAELRRAINHTFDYLNNPKLCGKSEYIDAYRKAVNDWLDGVNDSADE